MRFYKLAKPDYETDKAASIANPITLIDGLRMPAKICPGQGAWAGNRRIYDGRVSAIEDPSIRENLSFPKPLEDEWNTLAQRMQEALNLVEPLRPGDHLEPPTVVLKDIPTNDILHGFPGQIIVSEVVADALEKSDLTGFKLTKLNVKKAESVILDRLPELFEIVVRGQAWRVGVDLARIKDLDCPDRYLFPNLPNLTVDENRWDGSDFLNVDLNPNIVFVSENTKRLLQAASYDNIQFIPTE